MTFVNKYTAAGGARLPNVHLDTPQDDYDFNFVFPVDVLRSDRIELRPFVVSTAMTDGRIRVTDRYSRRSMPGCCMTM